ncbi:MAG: hypothetical protein JW955_04015 [Sedimentisphaerales bacterium]|nr:hypothetical protein [Sedimentisphaerales bacterium]
MTSRYTRLVGAAAVVLAALSFLFPGGNGIVPESVAWADVQKAMEQVHTIRVTGTRSFFLSQDEIPTRRLGLEKLFSFSHGYVDRTFTEDGQLMIEFAYDLPSGTMTVLFPPQKKYFRTKAPQTFHERTRQVTFQQFGEWLFVSGDYRKIGPNDVQGIQAIGFEVSDLLGRVKAKLGFDSKLSKLMDLFFSCGDFDARMWVNPETRRPIQLEAEGKVNPCLVTGYREMTLREIDDRWDYDVELDDAQFLPTIPEDYGELTLPVALKVQAALHLAGAASIAPILVAVRRSRRRRTKMPGVAC